MPLNDTAIRNSKSTDKAYKLGDSGGLFLLVNPGGSKLWRLKYRIDGREKLLALGAYPDVSLAKARERRDEAKRQIADDIDPAEAKRQAKHEAKAATQNSFQIVANELLAKMGREGLADVTLNKRRWLLDFAMPSLADRDVATIKASDILELLRPIEAKGNHETAKRVRAATGQVIRYAIATGRADNDPTFALRGALVTPKVRHRAAIIDEKAFGALLRSIDDYEGQPATCASLKLMALLFPRPGELRAATWDEFDLEKAVWFVPADRMKMRRPHRVPLAPQAVAILKDLRTLTGNEPYVFPAIGAKKRPISENTLNGALRRMGYGSDVATAHGFRATASTFLNESNLWNPDAIERQLAHAEANQVRRAYLRGEHWEERVRMMAWWADNLGTLKRNGNS